MIFYLYGLKRNLYLKPYELQRMQLKRFRALVKHAYERVPFYYRKFRSAGVKPDDIRGFNDLCKIPTTSKLEVQECGLKDMVPAGVNADSLIKRTTSGSTGIPLTILVDGRVTDFYTAVYNRALFEDGLRIRDRMAVVADPRSFPRKRSIFQRLGITHYAYISIFDSVERQMALLRDFRPDVIKGYASSLFILADELKGLVKEINPRLVFTGAELLEESSRKIISSAFSAEVFDLYACSEFSLLAWECEAHNGYHINADSVLMEFLDDEGESVSSGEMGNVVCTGLFNYVMPLIRYELDDLAVPVDDGCSCGRTLPLIRHVEGRADDLLVAADGRLITPTVFFPYPFDDLDGIRYFRVIQERMDKMRIEVVPRETSLKDNGLLEKAEQKIKWLFGDSMQVEFRILDEIPLDKSGKRRKVISLCSKNRINLK